MAGAFVALGPNGERLELRVDATGALIVTGISGGGGAGDASAANQATQITRETEIRDKLILPASLDADGGFKSHIQNFPTTQPVSGTFWQATQPVSVTGLLRTDKSAFTEGTTQAAIVGAVVNDTISADPAEDQAAALRMTSKRGVHTNLRDVAGVELATAANPARVDPTGTTTQPVSLASVPSHAVTGPLTDAQLRAAAVPVDTELPTGLVKNADNGLEVHVNNPSAGGGGGVQYTEGDVDSTITGTAIVWEDTGDALVAVSVAKPLPVAVQGTVPVSGALTDAQLRAAAVPVSGTFWQATQPVSGTFWQTTQPVSVTGLLRTDKSAFTEGTTQGAVQMGVFNDTIAADPTEDQAAALRITAKRGLHANLRDTAGAELATASNPARVDPTGTTTQPVSLASVPSHAVTGPLTDTQLRASAVPVDTELPAAAAMADAAANPTAPAVDGRITVYNGSTWDRVRGNTTIGMLVGLNPATLIISATGAASAAVTATLPAAGAGLFHYITRINIAQVAGTTAGAAAAPLVVTTTNLPGSLAITRPTAIAAGTSFEQDIEPVNPIKASAANTATTIVAPVHTNIIWRINVYYYTAP